MTANIDPIMTLIPVIGGCLIDTANANLDGSGTVGTVVTGGTDGTRITRITIKAIETTTAGVIRLFLHNGASYFLWREVLVTAITPSHILDAYNYTIELLGERHLVLPHDYSLRAATEHAEHFNVIAEGGDY